MSQIFIESMPPQSWETFEELICDTVTFLWKNKNIQRYGRGGQVQHGIDIYGADDENKMTGIQCKRKRQFTADGTPVINTTLTIADIRQEIALTIEGTIALERYIIATTLSRDTHLQNELHIINNERKQNQLFEIEVWFWEDIVSYINKSDLILDSYYNNIAKTVDSKERDKRTMTFIVNVFSRPAFQTKFAHENSCEDFISALKHTQEALNTGIQKDTDGKIIRRSYEYRDLTNQKWKKEVTAVYNNLVKLRDFVTASLSEDKIIQQGNYIEIESPQIADEINTIRYQILVKINKIAKELNIDPIESNLLR
jgi:hypothetical protein